MPDRERNQTDGHAQASAARPPRAGLERGSVRRILAWAALLGLGWITLIQLWAPSITQTQNQFVGNVAEVERFIYGSGPLPALVVGSSMVESFDVLTEGGLQVLGMNGMSAREGLQVLLRSGRVPDRLAVELNGLTAPPADGFLERIFNPVMEPLRRRVLALRTEYQPASVIMSLAKAAFGRGQATRAPAPHSDTLADIRIRQLHEQYRQPPNAEQLRANLRAVRDAVTELERRGVDVHYFEFPVPHGLSRTAFHESRRALNREILGDRATAAIIFDDDAYHTTDGIHLVPQEQREVAAAVASMLAKSAAPALP